LPGLVVAKHRVECGDDFAHAGGERYVLVLAGLKQARVKAFDVGVIADRDIAPRKNAVRE